MYDRQIYASRNLVFTGVNLVSSGINKVSSSGNIISKGAAHRAAPLADSPTSCPKSTESKKARPLNNEMAYADTPKGAGINSGYAFDVAKLQKNTETTKDKEQKRALETVVPGDGSPFKATAVSSVDGAKVRRK